MSKKYNNWLEEVWHIKETIAEDTKGMNFKDYWAYINKHAQNAEKEIKTIMELEKSKK